MSDPYAHLSDDAVFAAARELGAAANAGDDDAAAEVVDEIKKK